VSPRAGRRHAGLALACCVALGLGPRPPALAAPVGEPFRPHPIDPQGVLAAIAAARPLDLGGAAVTGLTLPHHRVATDLIATGMVTAARGPMPERIVLLTPDHFKRSPRPFATTTRDFDTVLGRVPTDRAAATALLRSPEVAPSVLFEREHGVGELLPYIARLFPGVPVLPVAVAIASTRAQWERLVVHLRPWVTPRTLVVQSTDFSHYLPQAQAVRRDQQMLNVLAAGDLDALARAQQPAQIDSRGSMYLQLRLQQQAFGAAPIVFGNYNSADHGATPADNTTSYVAQVYARAARGRVVRPAGDATLLCVAGDTFFGRHLGEWLAGERVHARVRAAVRERLQGCPLLVNLEGVLADGVTPATPMQLVMPAAQTLQWLREFGVVAVSVANNHSRDLGDDAYAAMVVLLREAGFVVLEHGRPQMVGPLRVVAFSDVDNPPRPARERLTEADLQALQEAGAAPDLALLHWGREFVAEPGARERTLAAELRSLGVPQVVGAHPHRASRGIALLGGPDGAWVPSLGNFIFDQRAPRASGAVLQISVFAQGTRAWRLIPWPDVDALGRAPREAGR
jgi:poly-gamma-glutamate synthesis protein (capsule biosynthesis protein)